MSVSPEQFTVSEGAVAQEFTVTYDPTADAEAGEAQITATVGELTASVDINYSARVTAYEQRTISEATSWDFSKTGLPKEVKYEGEDYNSTNLYANLGAAVSADFAGDALNFQGTYPIRNSNMAQEGTLSFTTDKDGVVSIKISDTGSSVDSKAQPRYLNVNGVNTEFWVSRPTSGNEKSFDEKTVNFFVPKGDVTITGKRADGKSNGSLCYYSLSWTPTDDVSANVTVTDALYATNVSEYALDYAKAGLTAYGVTVADNQVTLVQFEGTVPANTPVLLKAEEAKTYTVDRVTTGVAVKSDLKASDGNVTADGTQYGLSKNGGKVGFVMITPGTTIAKGKAYLEVSAESAKAFLPLDDETTGIEAVAAEEADANAPMFNIAGQRVSKDFRGVVIQNGKKFFNK